MIGHAVSRSMARGTTVGHPCLVPAFIGEDGRRKRTHESDARVPLVATVLPSGVSSTSMTVSLPTSWMASFKAE